MKNQRTYFSTGAILRLVLAVAIAFALSARAVAQTPGGTTISNQASATYSDGTNSYSTVSNTVTVTVSNVSGLAITPDAGSNPTIVAGQTGVIYNFTVTNTGNFTDQVHFLDSGASASLSASSPATITNVVIDKDNSGTINAGDTPLTAGAVDSDPILQNGSIHVLVEVSVNAGATAGQSVQVFLGDAATGSPSFDNQPVVAAVPSHEVRTVSAASVNGQREARGDISASVVNDALIQLTLNAPPGPVNLGSDITYTLSLQNVGLRNATAVTLGGLPAVYIIVPIPNNTVLKAGQTFPANTLYTTNGIGTAPLSASWSTTPPAPLSLTTRIAFPIAAPFAPGPATAPISLVVTVNTGIDASLKIDEIGDVFAQNSLGSAPITDQSDIPGSETPNNGDGNADFTEGYAAGLGHGVVQRTSLTQVGAVLVGPSSAPGAVGPTDNNDDYSNKSVNTGIAGVEPGGVTTASGQLIYVNTIQNTGNSSDTYTIDAPTVPAGFTVEVSTNGGASYTTVSGGGSVSLAIAFASSADINVRITAPLGKTVLTGYDTVVRVTSTITPASFNRTIDRLYTGFVRLDKAFTVLNAGVGASTDPVPGAVITYNITYTNVSTSNGDANCVKLTASNLVITEDGLAAPNNWGTYTTNSGSPSDSGSGTVVTVSATKYTDTIASLGPGTSAVFTFKRTIN